MQNNRFTIYNEYAVNVQRIDTVSLETCKTIKINKLSVFADSICSKIDKGQHIIIKILTCGEYCLNTYDVVQIHDIIILNNLNPVYG